MLGTIGRDLHMPRHDEAWCIDLSITEHENHAPLTSFEHITTAIVLAPMHEDFNILRADIAVIYHTKLGRGNKKGRNERLRPDQLPTLTIQHGSLSSRELQVLNSIRLRFVLNHV